MDMGWMGVGWRPLQPVRAPARIHGGIGAEVGGGEWGVGAELEFGAGGGSVRRVSREDGILGEFGARPV